MSDVPISRDDDKTIPDSEGLWRRIHPTQVIRDRTTGAWRPSSAAFKDQRGELSVDLASLTTPERALAETPQHSLAEVKAAVFRVKGYIVVKDPLPTNIAHALVYGKLTGAHLREIAGIATWIVLRTEENE